MWVSNHLKPVRSGRNDERKMYSQVEKDDRLAEGVPNVVGDRNCPASQQINVNEFENSHRSSRKGHRRIPLDVPMS